MAFEKRNWLARIGTGLNKFIIGDKDENNKQTLTNAPDSVTQQGDVISADNLNDLEDRIEAEFNVKQQKMVKIWENTSPTSAWASNASNPIVIDKPVKTFVIQYRFSNGTTPTSYYRCDFDPPNSSYYDLGDISRANASATSYYIGASISSRMVRAKIDSGSTYIQIFDCVSWSAEYDSGTSQWNFSYNPTSNSYLIPVAIYTYDED